MENTLENKARFFALYYGQKVICIRKSNEPKLYLGFDDFTPKEKLQTDYLELKPLSSITDEDVKGLFSLVGVLYVNGVPYTEYTPVEKLKGFILMPTFVPRIDMGDYLRHKGYALPYMGLSVEKMIEYGWIKTV